MKHFAPEVTSALAEAEGTVAFRYTLETPLNRPPESAVAVLETPPGSAATARLEIDPQLHMSFLRATDEGARVARVDLRPLIGGRELHIFLVWSSDEVRIHVGARDVDSPLLEASSKN